MQLERAAALEHHLFAQGSVARQEQCDLVAAGLEIEALKDAVEVVDDAHQEAVDEHLGILRRDLQAQRALVIAMATMHASNHAHAGRADGG